MADETTRGVLGCLVMLGVIVFFVAEYQSCRDSMPKPPDPETVQRRDAACRENLQCWGDRHAATAKYECSMAVERLAAYSHQWTDGWGSKFPRFMWKDQGAGILTYMGDRIQFQNGFGAWVNHSYFCDFDTRSGSVVGATATEGLLPP